MNQYTHLIATKKFATVFANSPEEAEALLSTLTDDDYQHEEEYEELIEFAPPLPRSGGVDYGETP